MKIVILTGAGISVSSGLSAFRSQDGTWSNFDINEVATSEAFKKDPKKVLNFYNNRKKEIDSAKPNVSHEILTKLQKSDKHDVTIVTQNIDDLHERSGSKVIHMHGNIRQNVCLICNEKYLNELGDVCPSCMSNNYRPNVVLFGEIPQNLGEIISELSECDAFISIGTSGLVYPASVFVDIAKHNGAETIEINTDDTEISDKFHLRLRGKSDDILHEIVEAMLNDEC